MYVKNHILSKWELTTVSPEESMENALSKINKGDFMSLPVLDGDRFVGILMKETIYRNYFEKSNMDREEYLKNTKVMDLYNINYKSINDDELIENASYLLKEYRTPFLPVFNKEKEFVGIHPCIYI